jgi:hypothetical protein
MTQLKKIYRAVLLLFSFLLLGSSMIAQSEGPQRILFVGNSYTYFWNLPQHVALMAQEGGVELHTQQSTAGGVNWGQHIRGEKELNTQAIIQEGDFDVVVLQNHSMSTIDRPDSLRYFGKILDGLVKKQGGQTYLYMTWAREWDPYMQEDITRAYVDFGKEIGAKVVPVGLAWQRARELRPGFPLYDEDRSHPSPLGTYLTACVFYKVFTGKSPVGLSERLVSEDKNGEKLYINIQSKENALFCQKVAEEIVSNWEN